MMADDILNLSLYYELQEKRNANMQSVRELLVRGANPFARLSTLPAPSHLVLPRAEDTLLSFAAEHCSTEVFSACLAQIPIFKSDSEKLRHCFMSALRAEKTDVLDHLLAGKAFALEPEWVQQATTSFSMYDTTGNRLDDWLERHQGRYAIPSVIPWGSNRNAERFEAKPSNAPIPPNENALHDAGFNVRQLEFLRWKWRNSGDRGL